MEKITLLVLFTALYACSTDPDPIEVVFTSYIKDKLNDPSSYEFVRVDSVARYALTYAEHIEALRGGATKDSLYSLPATELGHADAWVTYRAKNRLGGVITQRVYLQVEGGKVLAVKNWNEVLPHER